MMTAPAYLNVPAYGPVDICKKIRDMRFAAIPEFLHSFVAKKYAQVCKKKGYREANVSLIPVAKMSEQMLKCGDFNLRNDDKAVKDWADTQAERISHAANKTADIVAVCGLGAELCDFYGFKPPVDIDHPKTTRDDLMGMIFRLSGAQFWRRNMRKKQIQAMDQIARNLRAVHEYQQPYLSNEAFKLRKQQKHRNRMLLEQLEATNQDGFTALIAELADKSVSKPEIRRAELMVRLRGFEEVADKLGHVGVFYTITCPSKYHPTSKGWKNRKYNGSTPREAQDYLNGVWSGIRKRLKEAGIQVYGFRVAEPHSDGTPHSHMLFFMREEHRLQVNKIMRDHALKEDGTEKGADKYRFDVELIDKAKGGATAYISKYISKNIDGYGVDYDNYGHDAKQSAARICEWAGTWGIRQFQQIGGPSVTVWRELRRVKKEQLEDWEKKTGVQVPAVIKKARDVADWADWAAYVMLMGGPMLPAAERPIRTWMTTAPQVARIEGKTESIKPFRYGAFGDLVHVVKGVVSRGKALLTRRYIWDVKSKHQNQQQAPAFSDAQRSPWSSVNNCPEPQFSPSELEAIRQRAFQEVAELDQEMITEGNFCPIPPPAPDWVARVRQAVADRKAKNEAAAFSQGAAGQMVAELWAGWDTGELEDFGDEPEDGYSDSLAGQMAAELWGDIGYA